MSIGNVHEVTRSDVESLLFEEANLLDTWKLSEWLGLLSPDASYSIPSLDCPDGNDVNSLCLVMDDRGRIESRVKQLNNAFAWAENPRSRTRRMISNVMITERNDDYLRIEANFAVWRFKNGQTDLYVGRYQYRLVVVEGALLIGDRRAVLDLETLRPHGKLSFIL